MISNHPDIKSYVRRTGSENGLFATQTSRGDITIVLREDEDLPTRLYGGRLPKPVRPSFKDVEKDNPAFAKLLKEKEKELGKEGLKQWLRDKYRRRPLNSLRG